MKRGRFCITFALRKPSEGNRAPIPASKVKKKTIKTEQIMEIKIQISDAVYAQLLNGTKRVQGSIAMVNAQEGNFNAYARNTDKEKDTVYKLPHGTLRINDRRTSVRLWFDRKHERVNVAQAISAESRNASCYVTEHELIEFI